MATLVASLSASPREAGDEGGFSARGSSSGQPSRGHRVGEAETEVKGLAWGSHLSLMLKAFGLWAPVPRGGLAGEDRPWGCPSLPPSLEGASPAATAAPKPRYPSPQVQVRGAGPGPGACGCSTGTAAGAPGWGQTRPSGTIRVSLRETMLGRGCFPPQARWEQRGAGARQLQRHPCPWARNEAAAQAQGSDGRGRTTSPRVHRGAP